MTQNNGSVLSAPKSPSATAAQPAKHRTLAQLAGSRNPLLTGDDDDRRDSALLTASSSPPRSSGLSIKNDATNPSSRLPTPTIVVHGASNLNGDGHVPVSEQRPTTSPCPQRAPNPDSSSFLDLNPIPTGSFDDLTSPDRLQFSNRGSIVLLDGVQFSSQPSPTKSLRTVEPASTLRRNNSSLRASPRSSRAISEDDASLSQRVRLMYDCGSEDRTLTDQTLVEEDEESDGETGALSALRGGDGTMYRPTSSHSIRKSMVQKEPFETAGGIEDWEDIKGDEVDRYGFILTRKTTSRGSNDSGGSPRSVNLHRVSTALLDASNTPRRKAILRRRPSRASARRLSVADGTPTRKPSHRSLKPQGSIYSQKSSKSFINSQSSLRSAMGSKERRLLNDAGDMLTLPPGLAELADSEEKVTRATKMKEWEREGKWKKMGKLKPESRKGGAMFFDFDTKDPKLISRTWKGIPDRWRAPAWYSFLEASAKKKDDSPGEEDLIALFQEFQHENSADDVQIDCDVPRTINRHIMFRRRYRGGQRLLFRVLHALSLYFPEVGYVQGMAALAATLLCYYDEEHAFVMMVRLWQLRGLGRLYQSGFEGLMDALSEFETQWLGQGDVLKQLKELNIDPTAYGTRWYLTLFNYSIPFQAQLRVWDVFMLLGDASHSCKGNNGFGADLDVLHATSAALIDATREILLDSDFENAMKVLTSWIPIKDEDLLMKVANAEWRQRKKRG